MSLRSLVARVLLAMLAAVGLLWPLAARLVPTGTSDVSDPVVITDYRARFVVAEDGALSAVEDVTARFPSGRHGIFRYFDVADADDPGVRYVPTITAITADGRPAPWVMSWQQGRRFLVARIGDADTYLSPGQHRYRISYTIPGAVSPGSAGAGDSFASSVGSMTEPAGSALLWAVVARGWEMPIVRAAITMDLPAAAPQVQCSAGRAASPRPCTIAGAGTQQVTVSAAELPPRSGMRVRAAMAMPAPSRPSLPWSVQWDEVLGRSVPVVLLVAALSAAGFVVGLAWSHVAREDPPGFPVQYAPPDGLGPVQLVHLDTEGTGPDPLVATLLHLADRGLVRLDRDSQDSWEVTGLADAAAWQAVDPVAQSVARTLGVDVPGGAFRASRRSVSAGKTLMAARNGISPAVRSWAVQAGLVRPAPSEVWGRVVWGLCLLLALLGFVGPAFGLPWPTMWGLPAAMVCIGGVGLLATGVGRRRTTSGRLAWSRAGGFRRLLSTPSAEDRFDFAARSDLFIAYVPYAIAFGVADAWAEKYRRAVGAEPPVPAWYPVHPGMGHGGFYSGGGLDSFSSALSSSISAYTASQSSSSSGGGGGGGGFGGGGGGGGGSW